MIGAIILLGLSRSILAGEPAAFENYFDDSVKGVDISQDSAIKACLQNGYTLADKVKAAYNKCFGDDYDFDDLAGAVGSSDKDSDGLPDSFEGNEACFYQEMSWVDGSGTASADAIKADLAGLDAGLKGDFDGNIDACAAWSGNFGSRKKREAVPDVMGSGRAALNWLRSAVRKTRSADPEKGKEGVESGKGKINATTGKNGKKSGKGKRKSGKKSAKKNGKKNGKGKRKSGKKSAKKNGKKSGKGERKSGKKSAKNNGKKNGKGKRKSGKKAAKENGKKNGKGERKSGKKSAKKNGKKNGKGERKSEKKSAEKNGKKSGKGKRKNGKGNETVTAGKIEKKSGKKEKKSGKGTKKNSNGKESGKNAPKVLDEQTYNKLWCFDLSMEQVLEKCVEEKIKN